MNYQEEIPRHKKKSRAKPPKKANHKHYYEPCVLEFDGCRISQEHGITYDKPEAIISAYCPVCGKVGSLPDMERWYATRYVSNAVHLRLIEQYETDECKRELDQKTRTLPTFWVEDRWFTKYVEVPE